MRTTREAPPELSPPAPAPPARKKQSLGVQAAYFLWNINTDADKEIQV